MKQYDDEQNARGVYIIFLVVQMLLLAMMYALVYTAYVATKISIEKFNLNEVTAYAPTLIVFLAVPVVLHKTRSVFRQGRMMVAITWMMALLSVFLVGLIIHINNISGMH